MVTFRNYNLTLSSESLLLQVLFWTRVIRPYNEGYQLAKYEPKLLETLLRSDDQGQSNSYLKAMEQGKDQYEHEKMVDEMKLSRLSK